ncbi:putative dithiol-disulfide isomerase [Candidatus Arthromitus sp. SFB-rat-Yit]|nr:putative dithiol-disulfide isomerase [Candidatus Arthromitus sp. SFB-rat-Yit]
MFDKLEKEYPIKVEYYTKELHVDISENGIRTSELLDVLPNYSSILQILSNIGMQYGIKINDVKMKYNTKTALILSKFAKRYNKESEYINAIYKMMFENLDNISDLDKIQQVFANIGIPTNLTDEELKKCYVEYSNDASHAIDVDLTGVPFVIINDDIRIQGLREEKVYIQKIMGCLDRVDKLNNISKAFEIKSVSTK